MSNILITGGAGFIASALATELANNPDEQIVIVDNLVTGNRDNIQFGPNKNITFIKCDVNNYQDISGVFYAWKFDYVFHFAALVGVKRTLQSPVQVLNDINGIKNILNLSKNTGVQRVFYSSSSEVYGEPFEIPQNEHTTPLNSILSYAIVKNIGEAYLKAYHQEYGLDYTIFRFFNTYGINQSRDFVVNKFIHLAINDSPISLYGDGEQTRTFCYIADNVEVCSKIYRENLYINDVINVGSDVEITIKELAEKIVKACDSQSQIVHLDPLKEGDMRRRQPDITKMSKVLNRPLINLEQGLQIIINNLIPADNVRN